MRNAWQRALERLRAQEESEGRPKSVLPEATVFCDCGCRQKVSLKRAVYIEFEDKWYNPRHVPS
jgi:hypothetical protein